MLFTDASQPAFPDPWDVPTLSATPDEAEVSITADAEHDEPKSACQPAKQHSGWREMLTDIQHGLQWGLEH